MVYMVKMRVARVCISSQHFFLPHDFDLFIIHDLFQSRLIAWTCGTWWLRKTHVIVKMEDVAPGCWLFAVAVESIEIDHQMLPIVFEDFQSNDHLCQTASAFRQVSDLSLLQKEKTKMLGWGVVANAKMWVWRFHRFNFFYCRCACCCSCCFYCI